MSSEDKEKIAIMREGGAILGGIMSDLRSRTLPGVTPVEINRIAEALIEKCGVAAAFKNYRAPGSSKPFPASICVSVNAEVVHGIPTAIPFRKEDVVKLDMGILYREYFLDSTTTVYLGNNKKIARLVSCVRAALEAAVKRAAPGNMIGDIGNEIEAVIRREKFHPIENLCGHGIGKKLHENPDIPNFGSPGTGKKLLPGMTFAIEPMASIGSSYAVLDDRESFITSDGSLAAQFEATVAVGDDGPILLTPIV